LGEYFCTPRWLKTKEAARFAALGVNRLKELARDPDCPISGVPDPDSARGDWIFDRLSLDQYRMAQVSDLAVDKAVARLAGEVYR